eukprot:6481146-Amphidinium_carterae.1
MGEIFGIDSVRLAVQHQIELFQIAFFQTIHILNDPTNFGPKHFHAKISHPHHLKENVVFWGPVKLDHR